MTPRQVESSLLVVEGFTDSSGTAWQAGDRAPLARRAIREAAAKNADLFRVEFETLPFDPEAPWFQAIVTDYERRYQELKRRRDSEEAERQRELRAELEQQETEPRSRRSLERRYRKQEQEREQREKQLRDERERRRLENELEFGASGFGQR
jgi:hypothetical protein